MVLQRMQILLIIFSVAVTAFAGDGSSSLALVLDEQFDAFNLSLWQHEISLSGGGNWEFQYYSNNRTNSYVKDGALHIDPTLMADEIGEDNVKAGFTLSIWGSTPADYCTSNAFYGCSRAAGGGGNYLNPIKSARVRTVNSFAFKYGRVEVRAKLPRGDWLWPAIWLLPRDNQYGNWPTSGEIDIMESRGNPPSYSPGGYDQFSSTLHWGPYWNQNAYFKTSAVRKTGMNLTDDFHVYGFLWNETYMGTYLDSEDNPVLKVDINESFWQMGGWPSPPWANPWESGGNNAPFDREFFLILNVACGGTNGYFPDGEGKPWSNGGQHAVNEFWDANGEWYPTWTQPMIVDSIQVWSYVNNSTTDKMEQDDRESATTDKTEQDDRESATTDKTEQDDKESAAQGFQNGCFGGALVLILATALTSLQLW